MIRSRVLFGLLLGYTLFVVFGSLVPLHFQPMPIDVALQRFGHIPFLDLGIGSRADWVANLLLFIPLAYLACALVAKGARPSLGHVVAVTVLAGLGSVLLEFVQLFFPPRTVSQNDVLAETLGALTGAVAYRLSGQYVLGWAAGFFQAESGVGRLRRILVGYLVVLLGFNLMPLDLTFDVGLLFEKWSRGLLVLVPFSGFGGGVVEWSYAVVSDVVIWIPFAWLLRLAGYSSRRTVFLTVAAAGLIEFAQLFVYSRVSDVTDILLAGVGAWLAGPVMAVFERAARRGRLAAWAGPGVVAWGLALLAVFWWPFDFDFVHLGAARVSAMAGRTLFETYYFTSEYHALNELLRKVAFFLPLGVLWALRGGRRGTGTVLFVSTAMLVEGGQLFLPEKVADVTDMLIEASGALLGLWLARRVIKAAQALPTGGDEAAQAVPPRARHDAPAPRASMMLATWGSLLVVVLALALLPGVPGVPYNVRELFGDGVARLFVALALGAYIWSLGVGALMLVERLAGNRWASVVLPLALLAHGLIGFLLLDAVVPLESLDDVLGSPVLGWVAPLEHALRFLALDAMLGFAAVTAASLLVSLGRGGSAALGVFISLVFHAVWLCPLLYWGIVREAATDNLTELLRDNAAFSSWLALLGALFGTWLGGGALAGILAGRLRAARGGALLVVGLAMAGGLGQLALEPLIVKYGQVFSAWQFLLSPDRAHYVGGEALVLRAVVLLAALVLGLAILLFPSLRARTGARASISPTRGAVAGIGMPMDAHVPD
ncbi:VanZ family protein [Nitrogeniibacter mangrovi]|uniref:VanZ family protein n=1 Tax=Nitrogeniibacter mangrovi TaxID=2016596 RepID=UPI001C2CF792|nr:VanZ family protein [Nitrogeniibacter mangrovi]